MHKLLYFLILPFVFIGFNIPEAKATHGMGGEITWECQGNGDYVFELTFYRDCNGFEINTNFETLEVWGHSSLNSIQVDFVSRTDISPSCTPAAGNVPSDCGTGVSGGNGIGAVEEIVYRSSPISISGTPPNEGWHFTYQNFSRSANLTNIVNPSNYGITLTASMFPIPGATGGCIDNSPTFLQSPYIVSCSGEEYNYNPNGIDEDLDSLHFRWGDPLDYFPTGAFDPPNNPAPVPFEAGFSFDNPTPDNTFDPNNQAAQIDSENGAITFTSFTQGNFATKVVIEAFRKGVKIASVEREIQLIVSACSGNNSAPTVTPPFAGGTSFETTIFAGETVNFDIVATDVENLQNGSPQSVTISSSGLMYGAGFTNPNSGCITSPCATLDASPSVTGSQGATLSFDWQTTCDHLVGATGQALNEVPYVFVFKVKDDYCPTPKAKYVTVTINVKNKNVLPAPEITCITTDSNGDLTINWNPITDSSGDFDSYELFGLSGGYYGTISNINANNQVLNNVGAGNVDGYYITTKSGCNGETVRSSDTIKNIYLDLNNPGNGEAVLQWNQPNPTQLSHFNDYFHIYQEYPTGTWNLIDSVLYNTTNYSDTITICEGFLNYQIVLPTTDCNFTSNIEGDVFEDQIVPSIPDINSVNIDTLTNNITVSWDVNSQSDTYGYVVYQEDLNGDLVEIDTVWGRTNTSFTHSENLENGPFKYSIAAFDSCFTANVPPTYQTSAKAAPHTTNKLSHSIDACERLLSLTWSGYIGFDSTSTHKVFARINEGTWEELGQSQSNSFSTNINSGEELIIVVQTISDQGETSFSDKDTVSLLAGQGPEMSHLSVATVEGEEVKIKHRVTVGDEVKAIKLQRFDPHKQLFKEIDEKVVGNNNEIIFTDSDVEVNRRSYTYRTADIDTCGLISGLSNIGKTVFLKVLTDEEKEIHTLQWTPYEKYIGGLSSYKIFRSLNGEFDPTPLATVPYNKRSYTDTVTEFGDKNDGEICYIVAAIESSNEFGLQEKSYSNEACGIIAPIIYIPNAFTVGGKNPIFKPETRQRKIDDYLFEIYDRFGRIIFETRNPEEGWNGQLNGQSRYANEGVYVYRLSLRNGSGIEVIKHGHVTLLDYRGIE